MSHILLVEDSPTQAIQMKMLLESAEHTVVCCDDGTSALEALATGTSELVVTDLELPVMNGLELIRRMLLDFPQIPAILVTAQGSERLAAEALKSGATAYVPKALLDSMLLGTVEDVLGVLRTDRSYVELIDCTVENRIVFSLPNCMRLLTTAVDLTMQMAAGMKLLSGVDRYRVSNALQHAASNALYRGNLELTHAQWQQCSGEENDSEETNPLVAERLHTAPYKDRRIHFDARLMKDLIRVVIRDEGRGFKHHQLMSIDDPHLLTAEHGRGMVVIRNFMDKVSFNESGNEITMIKQARPTSTIHS